MWQIKRPLKTLFCLICNYSESKKFKCFLGAKCNGKYWDKSGDHTIAYLEMQKYSSNSFLTRHLKGVFVERQSAAVPHSGKNSYLLYWRFSGTRWRFGRQEIPRPTVVRFPDLCVIPTAWRIL